jgi:hypothetical protein
LRQEGSQVAQGTVPSHGPLLTYHDLCTREKDNIFSEISTALAPSQNVEKTHGVSGLWPRITPRSLLHQLTRDRINKLPDQWRSAIMRYATSLLKYRHSVRLLELSSGQRNEELLRETEAIRSDVLAESTPDWLLIQVRPLFSPMISQHRIKGPWETDRGKSPSSSSSGSCGTLNAGCSELKSRVWSPRRCDHFDLSQLLLWRLDEGSNALVLWPTKQA